MNKKWMRLAAVGIAASMALPIFAACTPGEEQGGDPTQLNETRALQISSGAFDQVFNPFFATSQYDANVVGQTQIGMLGSDADGLNVTYGPDEPVVTLDYSEIMYTATNQVTTNGDVADHTVYQFVIKNDILFSDGVPLTAHDVLFNLYMYLDPNYTGSNTLYSTDIVGLREYQNQDPNATEGSAASDDETYNNLANQRLNAILTYVDDPDDTAEWQERVNFYNESVRARFENYDAENSASNGGNITDLFVEYGLESPPPEEGEDGEEEEKPAPSIRSDIEAIKEEFRNELQTIYNSVDMNTYRGQLDQDTGTYSDGYDMDPDKVWQGFFFEAGVLSREYRTVAGVTVYETDENGNFLMNWDLIPDVDRNADMTEEEAIEYAFNYICPRDRNITDIIYNYSTGSTMLTTFAGEAREAYYGAIKKVAGGLAIPSISGIRILDASEFDGGTQYAEGEYEMLQITINGIDPRAKWNFAFSVAPMHYYSTPELTAAAMNDTTYSSNFGVKYSSVAFMNEVRRRNRVPVGAGVYQASTMYDQTFVWEANENWEQTQASNDSFQTLWDGFLSDNIVYLIRNDNYYTTGGNTDEVYNAKIKHVQYKVQQTTQMVPALQSQDIDVADPSATQENLNEIEATSFLSYSTIETAGYGYIGINAKFIPNIYIRRALMTVFNPSYVQDYYPGTLSRPVYRCFSTTSWVYDAFDDAGVEVWAPTSYYGFDDSFAKAKDLLYQGQCTFENNTWYDENGEPIEITLTIAGETYDHPAYQTFIRASEILNEYGIRATVVNDARALFKLASGDLAVWAAAWSSTVDPDMFQVFHMDSQATSVLNWGYDYLITQNMATPEEREIIEELSDKIDEGRETIVQSERAQIYREASDIVMELAVEFPLYQRSDIFVYNSDLIDKTTLVQDTTPYRSPFSEIWKVSYKG